MKTKEKTVAIKRARTEKLLRNYFLNYFKFKEVGFSIPMIESSRVDAIQY